MTQPYTRSMVTMTMDLICLLHKQLPALDTYSLVGWDEGGPWYVRDFHISEEESDRWGYRTIVDGGEEDAVRIALERNVERLDWVLRPDYFRPNKARDPEFPLHLSEVMRFVQTYGRNKG